MEKHLKAAFNDFFDSPTHQRLDELLRSHGGEYDNLDFKSAWPEFPKVARHIIAMGNCGGGVLVVGVKELPDGSLKAEGLDRIQDKAEIYKKVSKYLPRQLEWRVYDFSFEDGNLSGKKFQVAVVEYRPHALPLVSEASSGDAIRRAAVYVRRGTCSEEADYQELQRVINARIETSYSSTKVMSLQEHLEELKALYQQVPTHKLYDWAEPLLLLGGGKRNPDYPQESYEQYIAKIIEKKKRTIEALIESRG